MTPPAAGSPTPPPTPRRLPWFHFVFLTLLALTGLAGGILMWASSLRQRPAPVIIETSPPTTELPVYATLRQSLTATERSGQTVTTTALRGKVWVAAYTYTRCPRGCLGVVATMLKLRDEFSSEPRFHQVSVAVDPAYDRHQRHRRVVVPQRRTIVPTIVRNQPARIRSNHRNPARRALERI